MNEITHVVVIGAGFAFKEVSELIDDINSANNNIIEIHEILDDDSTLWGKRINGVLIKGGLDLCDEYDKQFKFVFAIGSHRTQTLRFELTKRLSIPKESYINLVHPSAKIFSDVYLGNGCIVHYGTVIFSGSYLYDFCIISASCVIGVNNIIGTGAMLGSGIITTTGVKIGCFTFVGSGTTIGEGISIGSVSKIGIGSLVLRKIKPGVTLLGNPPKILAKIDVIEEINELWEEEKKNKNGK